MKVSKSFQRNNKRNVKQNDMQFLKSNTACQNIKEECLQHPEGKVFQIQTSIEAKISFMCEKRTDANTISEQNERMSHEEDRELRNRGFNTEIQQREISAGQSQQPLQTGTGGWRTPRHQEYLQGKKRNKRFFNTVEFLRKTFDKHEGSN